MKQKLFKCKGESNAVCFNIKRNSCQFDVEQTQSFQLDVVATEQLNPR